VLCDSYAMLLCSWTIPPVLLRKHPKSQIINTTYDDFISRRRSPYRGRHSHERLSRSPVYLREQARQLERDFDREVDMKVKVIENRLHEERLKAQQQNDNEIQKVSV